MSDFLSDLANDLSAQGIGTVGTNLFIDGVPDTANVTYPATTLNHSGGMKPDVRVGIDYPSFQVVVRGDAYGNADALAKAWDVFNVLQSLTEKDVGATHVHLIVAMQSQPTFLGKDANNRPSYAQNYYAIIRDATTHRE